MRILVTLQDRDHEESTNQKNCCLQKFAVAFDQGARTRFWTDQPDLESYQRSDLHSYVRRYSCRRQSFIFRLLEMFSMFELKCSTSGLVPLPFRVAAAALVFDTKGCTSGCPVDWLRLAALGCPGLPWAALAVREVRTVIYNHVLHVYFKLWGMTK